MHCIKYFPSYIALVHSSIYPFNHPTFIVYLLYSRSAVNASTEIVVCNVIHSSLQHFETEWKIIYYPYAKDEGSGYQKCGSLFLRLYSLRKKGKELEPHYCGILDLVTLLLRNV